MLIWSQLWAGRMRHNLGIYQHYRQLGRPVIMIDVGLIRRNHTWKISLDGDAYLAGNGHSATRSQEFGLHCRPWTMQGRDVVLALQRSDSNQWSGQPDLEDWCEHTVNKLRKHTDRPITVRPHPRLSLRRTLRGVTMSVPNKMLDTYDDYDFVQGIASSWAVVNWNSSPGVISVLEGVPAFVGSTSLAAPVANLDLGKIETPDRPDRSQWINDLAWTEWTQAEMSMGLPHQHILSRINSRDMM